MPGNILKNLRQSAKSADKPFVGLGRCRGGGFCGADDSGQGVLQGVQARGVGDGAVVGVFDIKGVDGHAALGADAGEGDVEALVADGLAQAEQQADFVARLDFHDGALHGELVVNVDRRREGGVHRIGVFPARKIAGGRRQLARLRHDVGIKVLVLHERGFDCPREDVLDIGALDHPAAGLDDVKCVDGDVVAAGDDFGPQDGQPGDAEGSGQLVEQASAIPGHHVHDRERTVEVVLPIDDGHEGADGLGIRNGIEQPVHHLDMEGNLARVRVDEIPLGQQVEMRRDLVQADTRDALGGEFLKGHLQALRVVRCERRAVDKPLERRPEERGVERVLVAVPEAGRRPARVAERMDVEVAQAVGVTDHLCEGSRRIGIINIPLLPKPCHDQMIFDDEEDKFAAGGVDFHPVQERPGDGDPAFGMSFDPPRFSDIMKQENEIEQRGVGSFVQRRAVFQAHRLGIRKNIVQLADGVQRMDVGGVAVVKFVLNEAGQGIEFGYEPAQHA